MKFAVIVPGGSPGRPERFATVEAPDREAARRAFMARYPALRLGPSRVICLDTDHSAWASKKGVDP